MLAAGSHELSWDGFDGGGDRVATGIYLVRLNTAAGTTMGRVVLLR